MDSGKQTVAMRPVNVLRIFKPADTVEQSVIGSGLQPGEMVISEGQMRLFPGGKVRLLAPEGTAGKPGASAAPGAF
jgi:multidrug efflux system membrane fusion protein